MPRHRGLQHKMRLEEIAGALAYAGGDVRSGYAELRRLEEQAAVLKKSIEAAQVRLDRLQILQTQLIECELWTEFGLPAGMTNDHFTAITGHKITS
jgi:hypothetical protein